MTRFDDSDGGLIGKFAAPARVGILLALVAIAIITVSDCVTVLGPNQVACFRTFGNPDCGPPIQVAFGKRTETSHQYYGQGLHFIWPWITAVDKLQISQRLTDPNTVSLTLGRQNQP